MNWFTTGITFIILWWLVLFMVLPFGARPPDEVEPGMAPSAPERPRMALKVAITTAIAAALTVAVLWFVESGLIELRPSP